MRLSCLFVPRMHEEFSYSFYGNTLNFSAIDYFTPFGDNSLEKTAYRLSQSKDHSPCSQNSEASVSSAKIAQTCQNTQTCQSMQACEQTLLHPFKPSPPFVLSEGETKNYYYDLLRFSAERSRDGGGALVGALGTPFSNEMNFTQDEYVALQNFSEKMTVINSDFSEHSSSSHSISSHQEQLCRGQRVLLLAWLQEEQSLDLLALETHIAQKDAFVNNLLKNSYEAKIARTEIFSDALQQELENKGSELQQSYTFSTLKEHGTEVLQGLKQGACGNIMDKEKIVLSCEAVNTLFASGAWASGTWEAVFSKQLLYIPSQTLLFVNDTRLHEELLSLVTLQDENLVVRSIESEDDILKLAKHLKKEFFEAECSEEAHISLPLHLRFDTYYYMACPPSRLFKEKDIAMTNFSAQKLHFIFPKK